MAMIGKVMKNEIQLLFSHLLLKAFDFTQKWKTWEHLRKYTAITFTQNTFTTFSNTTWNRWRA